MEGSLVAYKVFTNGSVLQASEVNENLMRQAVATFTNAAARTAAITSPVEGQMTYLESTKQYATWNGSAWVSPFGMTLLNTTPFTTATSVAVNNVFSSAYDNYKIVLDITSGTVANTGIRMRLRSGGTDNTSSNYQYGNVIIGVVTAVALGGNNASTEAAWPVAFSAGTPGGTLEATVTAPFLTSRTKATVHSAGAYLWVFGGVMTVTTSYDGFNLYPDSGNITGTLRVYGLRN